MFLYFTVCSIVFLVQLVIYDAIADCRQLRSQTTDKSLSVFLRNQIMSVELPQQNRKGTSRLPLAITFLTATFVPPEQQNCSTIHDG